MFKKLFLIFVLTFIGSFAFLNFSFLSFQVKEKFNAKTVETAKIIDPLIQPRLLPIALNKNLLQETKKTAVKPAKIQTSAISIPIKSKISLEIPSLGVKAPIVFEPTTNEDKIYKSLEKGVVHYSSTPQPGNQGTSIIIGHSSVYPWYKGNYGYVFSNLANLKIGDIINVEEENKLLTYKVSQSIIFSPITADDFALRELETTVGSTLVLMTCWPTGTNAKRVAVRADLVTI